MRCPGHDASVDDGSTMMSRRATGLVCALLVFTVLGGMGVALGAASRSSPPRAELARGSVGSFGWSAFVSRGPGAGGAFRPCIQTRLDQSATGAVFGKATVCGAPGQAPIVTANSVGEGMGERAVLALVFPRRATSVRLWLQGHAVRTIPLEVLSEAKARKTGVAQFRFAVIGVAGPFCVQRFIAMDQRGAPVGEGAPGC
jgi:hypothetical protein